MKRILFLIFLAACLFPSGKAQMSDVDYTVGDSLLVERFLENLAASPAPSTQEGMLKTAHFFLETPYVGGTLEHEPEELVVNLRELDCTTFVETVLALLWTAENGATSFRDYCNVLRQIRYRFGEVSYLQRLHYTADWKFENEKSGLLKDVTAEIPGAKPLPLSLSFISTHVEAYPPLKKHSEWVETIRQQEKTASRRAYFYLPKENLSAAEAFIQDGDILGFVTSIEGLDVTHLAIACREKGKLTFLHASSSAKKVVLNSTSLQMYLAGMKKTIGLWVFRPVF